ncbi:hypothetical protein GBSOP10_10184 [Armatimonadetes bacterium GBS]|jgi:hypothetical protein|nr:hypothetical protein HRbin14_01431 [bacterium HR14]GIV12218.1 MAG: hypothetical protein KatS3mg021_0500 [Fimbriimonadales bacterium]CUU02384.1 hypothetical protein GBSOP10_10184 [Armatimonadetes bacterium GBS]CUU36993.1 hypothetical protein GXSOP10_12990 [Armatimonadetes bacterium GXS]
MAQPAPLPEPEEERPPLWVFQEAFESEEAPLEHPQDVYIAHLLQSLPRELVESFTPEQYESLKRALRQYHRRHLVDIRGVIPILFVRYYFVFLFGRDRRTRQEPVSLERRAERKLSPLVGWLVMGLILAMLVLGALGAQRLLSGF